MVISLRLLFVLIFNLNRLRYSRFAYMKKNFFKILELNLPLVASQYVATFKPLRDVHYHVTSNLRLSLAVTQEAFFETNRNVYFNVLHRVFLRKTEIRLAH